MEITSIWKEASVIAIQIKTPVEPQTKCRAITPQGNGQDQIQGTAVYDNNNTRLRIHPYTRTEYRSNKNRRRAILIDDHFQAIGRFREAGEELAQRCLLGNCSLSSNRHMKHDAAERGLSSPHPWRA